MQRLLATSIQVQTVASCYMPQIRRERLYRNRQKKISGSASLPRGPRKWVLINLTVLKRPLYTSVTKTLNTSLRWSLSRITASIARNLRQYDFPSPPLRSHPIDPRLPRLCTTHFALAGHHGFHKFNDQVVCRFRTAVPRQRARFLGSWRGQVRDLYASSCPITQVP